MVTRIQCPPFCYADSYGQVIRVDYCDQKEKIKLLDNGSLVSLFEVSQFTKPRYTKRELQ